MSSITEFFLLEARESLDGLDRLLASATESGVDAAELHRLTRALRGSAQLARQTAIREIAGSIENEARAITQGRQKWNAATLAHARQGLTTLRDLVIRVAAGEEIPADASSQLQEDRPDTTAPPAAAPHPPQQGHEESHVSEPPQSLTGTLVEQAERLAGELSTLPEPGERAGDLVALLTRIRDRTSAEGLAEAAALSERALARLQMGGTAAVVALMPRLAQLVRDGEAGDEGAAAAPGIRAPQAEPAGAVGPDRGEEPTPATHRWEDGVDDVELEPPRSGAATGEPAMPARPTAAAAAAVPIEELCYQGERALERALSLRDELEETGSLSQPAHELLDEVFDLIRLGMK